MTIESPSASPSPNFSDPICSHLPWDTAFWGFRIAKLNCQNLDEPTLAKLESWCETDQTKCLYLLADGTSAETLHWAQTGGFRFIDLRVELEKKLAPPPSGSTSSHPIRRATSDDRMALRQLARVAHSDTRFFKDLRFARSKCEDLYATWIERDLNQSVIMVSPSGERTNEINGYVSYQIDSQGRGQIGLLAVAAADQGRGLGKALISAACRCLSTNDVTDLRVVTQGTNVAALRLYESLGFRTRDAKVWFHRWFGSQAT